MKYTKNSLVFAVVGGVMMMLMACGDSDHPNKGWVFMPDMFYSQAYETYVPSPEDKDGNPYFEDGKSALLPPSGTIARGTMSPNASGHISYNYKNVIPNTNEGYEMASRVTNPIMLTAANKEAILKEGKTIYTKYCSMCHGEKGEGQGILVTNEVFAGVINYKDVLPKITEGQMFHSITYGKNLMGSHSSQVSVEERWKVIHYISTLAGMDAKISSAVPTQTEGETFQLVTNEETGAVDTIIVFDPTEAENLQEEVQQNASAEHNDEDHSTNENSGNGH